MPVTYCQIYAVDDQRSVIQTRRTPSCVRLDGRRVLKLRPPLHLRIVPPAMRPPRGLACRSRCGWSVSTMVPLIAVSGLCFVMALHQTAQPQRLSASALSWRPQTSNMGRLMLASPADSTLAIGQIVTDDFTADATDQWSFDSQEDAAGTAPAASAAASSRLAATQRAPSASSKLLHAVDVIPVSARPAAADMAARLLAAEIPRASANPRGAAVMGPAFEPPGHATVAICLVTRIDADDPQWVDGRAEDLHEARGLLPNPSTRWQLAPLHIATSLRSS